MIEEEIKKLPRNFKEVGASTTLEHPM